MKTVNAEEFNKNPLKIYREADLNNEVRINHLHYPDKIFVLSARKRRETEEDNDIGKERC